MKRIKNMSLKSFKLKVSFVYFIYTLMNRIHGPEANSCICLEITWKQSMNK